MNQSPPKFFLRFLRWFCDPWLLEDVEGDLMELYAERAKVNPANARRMFMLDVLKLFRPGIIKNFEEINFQITGISMINNYILIAWRNLMKYKVFSVINILSLSVGIAICLVIYLFVNDERSFDNFHERNIYRLCEVESFTGTKVQVLPFSMGGMGPTMHTQFPEIRDFNRVISWNDQIIEFDKQKLLVDGLYGADENFFNFFNFKLLKGDPQEVISGPQDAVISQEMAVKVFGQKEAVGKTFKFQGNTFLIKGIMENIPENSHLQFDIMISMDYFGNQRENWDAEFRGSFITTYFDIKEGSDLDAMRSKFPEYLAKNSGRANINEHYELFLQPLSEIHLGSNYFDHDYYNYRKFNGFYVRVFIMAGILLLLIATINFTNLSTARSTYRVKEVGVRKTLGAIKHQLVSQFLMESVLLSFMALALALLFLWAGLPYLNKMLGREYSVITLMGNLPILCTVLIVSILLGVLAGLYPSLNLSRLSSINAIKGLITQSRKSMFRGALVVAQFSLAIGLIVSTLVVADQMLFIKNKNMGFSKDHMLLVSLNNEKAASNYENIKQELLARPNILGVTAMGHRLGNDLHQRGFKVRKDSGMVIIAPSSLFVDKDFLKVYDIKITRGRNFSNDFAADNGGTYIINQSLAEELSIENPIGAKAGMAWHPDDSLGQIIAVTEDFHFSTLHDEINNLVLAASNEQGYNEMTVKLNGENLKEGIKQVVAVYEQFAPDYPITYEFLDSHFDQLYKADTQMGNVIMLIAVLAILIGSMGLFGLSSITTQRRIKEIGIRKVMGATIGQLYALLSKDFMLQVVLSFLIATPLAYTFMFHWLENFAFRITINPWLFIAGGVIASLIALMTISYHVLKVSTGNPVKALRYE